MGRGSVHFSVRTQRDRRSRHTNLYPASISAEWKDHLAERNDHLEDA
jgi:hypothetical protein